MSRQTLAARLQYDGGDQLGRINKNKLRSLQAALKNDYNSRMIKVPNNSAWPCLINTNNLKPDYDKKIISVEFDSGLRAGDVFTVLDDHSHWMVYLPILTETAYLRAEIIRCRYQIELEGKKYWIYFQGPTETDLRWGMKNNINFNKLNLSGTIYIKNTPETKKYFKRFTKIKLDGHMWEVQVTDSISVPGVLELEIQEFYDNSIEELPDVMISKDQGKNNIIGLTTVKQNGEYGYEATNDIYNPQYEWSVSGNQRVALVQTYDNNRLCKVKVYPGAIREYQVNYGPHTLKVNIDISKPYIRGKQNVYPYDIIEYSVKNDTGSFWINDYKYAKILEEAPSSCMIEIIYGKSGSFVLNFKSDTDNNIYELPITIESL